MVHKGCKELDMTEATYHALPWVESSVQESGGSSGGAQRQLGAVGTPPPAPR